MAAKLSINVNKYALLRNSRGHDAPNLLWAADECIAAGAHGITVHPRLDQRHVRFDDVPVLARHLRAKHAGIEYNVECEDAPSIIDMVLEVRPDQCTLVPVTPGEVTSDHGFQEGDVIVEFDGHDDPWRETDLIAFGVTERKPGDKLPVVVLRGGERLELTLPMQ